MVKYDSSTKADIVNTASAVSRIDNLEFLSDVIPKTTTYREYKEKKAKTVKSNARLSSGQTTLDNSRALPSRPADVMNSGESQAPLVDVSPDGTTRERDFGGVQVQVPQTNGEVVFEHYEPDGRSNREGSEDIEMG